MSGLIGGLYIGGERVSAVALRRGKKAWTLAGAMSVAVAVNETTDEGNTIAPALKPLIKSLKLTNQPTTLCLPKQQGILRDVTLPSIDKSELDQMARFETERHIPFHAERHCTGYHVMRSMGVEGSEVLLAAVDGPIVERALDGAVAAGIQPDGITLSSVGLMNSVIHSRRDWIGDKTIMVVDIGLELTDIILVHQGRLIFSRSVATDLRSVLQSWLGNTDDAGQTSIHGPERLATAAKLLDCLDPAGTDQPGSRAANPERVQLVQSWLQRLILEINRTYDFARREMKCPPVTALLMTGEGALLRNLGQYLYVNVNVEVETLNPVRELEGFDKVKPVWDGFEFTIPFGTAISHELKAAYRIDITPREHYRQLARKKLYKHLAVTGVLLILTLSISIAAWMRHVGVREQMVADYRKVNKAMKPVVAELDEMKAKQEIIDRFLKDPESAMKVLNTVALAPMIPEKVSLVSITYEKGGDTVLDGRAKTLPDIYDFQRYLRDSGLFLLAELGGNPEPVKTVGSQMIYDFTLNCPLLHKTTDKKGKR